jgi:hypothetical protein
MNLDFADALRRRPEPAWPFAAAFALTGLGPRRPLRRCSRHEECRLRRQKKNYFFFAFFFFLAFFAFFAFFAMLPS